MCSFLGCSVIFRSGSLDLQKQFSSTSLAEGPLQQPSVGDHFSSTQKAITWFCFMLLFVRNFSFPGFPGQVRHSRSEEGQVRKSTDGIPGFVSSPRSSALSLDPKPAVSELRECSSLFTVLGSCFLVFWFCSFLLGVCNKQSVFRKTIPRIEMC